LPRYFFHIQEGSAPPDVEGIELPGLAEARRVAVQTACAMISHGIEDFWGTGEWQMRVTDEAGLDQFRLTFFATDAPATASADIHSAARPERQR
jgi:hypothetical protein